MRTAPLPRRGRWALWSSAALLALLVAEAWLLVQVGHAIGTGRVLVLLLVETLVGALVLRRAGRRALEALRHHVAAPPGLLAAGRRPGGVGDALLAGAGGVLLVLPGLLSDVLGLLCLFPPTRRVLRRAGAHVLRRRLGRLLRAGGVVDGEVLDGEVLDGEVVEEVRGARELGRGRRS